MAKGIFTDKGADEIQAVLEFITEHPEKHKQENWLTQKIDTADELSAEKTWTCGTAGCFAGWYAVMTGWTPVIEAHLGDWNRPFVYVDRLVKDDVTSAPDDTVFRGTLTNPVVTHEHDLYETLRASGLDSDDAYDESWRQFQDQDVFKLQRMFAGSNTIEDLWRLAGELSEGYIKP